ncbi:MAG TPA: fumarylacetoacetate hydrolase family protein [Planctomycetota bacterium]|nr:fumarylacetoacetate hydrolase family protein [Planctomycetota bacterium]
MRLATVLDRNTPHPVVLLKDGTRVDYRLALEALHIHPPPPDSTWPFPELNELVARHGEFEHWVAGVRPHDETLQTAPLLSPVPRPRTFRDFYAFEQHVKTARARRKLEMIPQWYEIPVFYFSNPNSLLGPDAEVFAPRDSAELDYELELGVVIGKAGRDIPEEKAWEHVAGFTIINDFSARDLQRKEMGVGLGPAKGKDFATGVGPHLVTLDEVQDRISADGKIDLQMSARVNGKELSRGNANSMYYTWPRLIAQASRDAELFEGDLIGSGTVGTGCILELGPENTGGWLKPGHVVELEIERLGVLKHRIVERPKP